MEIRIREIENGFTMEKDGRIYYYADFTNMVQEMALIFQVFEFEEVEDGTN